MKEDIFSQAGQIIKASRHLCAFTGAGISTESGIPPFRGKDGLWSKFDPIFLDLDYFHKNPKDSWRLIKQIFYDFFGKSNPNPAHYALARLEEEGIVKAVITQNIDNLHQKAGSKNVIEFHGNSRYLVCENCGSKVLAKEETLKSMPPLCLKCGLVLKPDFVFFGEPIPTYALDASYREAETADVFLVIGTTGQIQPASSIPIIAKRNGAKIIEVNIEPSSYTNSLTDIFLAGKASEVMQQLLNLCL